MKTPLLSLALLYSMLASSQYYYNDIVSTQETNRQMQVWLAGKVSRITATGFDANGVKATDFSEVKEIRDNGRTLKVSTRNSGDYSAFYNEYDAQGRIIRSTDTSLQTIRSSTQYQYDGAGRLTQVKTLVSDLASAFEKTEVHEWLYNAKGQPEKMWRIINQRDTLEIRFIPDEKGNPGEEVLYKWGEEASRIYYYFDDAGRVTDIVRYNEKVRKLLPDIMLTYDDKGQLIQKITSTGNDNLGKVTWVGYIIWRYLYNEKGLKTKEALFDKDQQLTGKIEYSYQFHL